MSIDYLIDEDDDMVEDVLTSDFTEGESDGQHIEDIIRFEPGEMKYDVLVGVGIEKQINGQIDDGSMRKMVNLQLEADNYQVKTLTIKNGIIDVDARKS